MVLGRNEKIAIGVGLAVVVVVVIAIVLLMSRKKAGAFSNKMVQSELTGHCWNTEPDSVYGRVPYITLCTDEHADRWSFKPVFGNRDPITGLQVGQLQSKKTGLCMARGDTKQVATCLQIPCKPECKIGCGPGSAPDCKPKCDPECHPERTRPIHKLVMRECDAKQKSQHFVRHTEAPPDGSRDLNYIHKFRHVESSTKYQPYCVTLGNRDLGLEECYPMTPLAKDDPSQDLPCSRVQKWIPYGG